MSSTLISKIEGLFGWLEDNAFWNSDLVEVKKSPWGGLGVFWKLKDQPDPSGDTMILRIPKSSVLSPKNSFLYNLLLDYEPSDPAIDLTQGMHAIVLTFLYEQSLGERSPWHAYLCTFELNADEEMFLPLCLWSEEEKKALFNTECDLLSMLDSGELVSFYLECVNFAKTNDTIQTTPDILKLEEGEDVTEEHPKLRFFAKCIQTVVSRAFTVDRYHGLSLVPGADLFNHLSPVRTEEGVVPGENVQFVCDDDEGLCERCGESDCGHEDESDEEAIMEEEGEFNEEEERETEQKDDSAVEDLMETIPLSSDSEDSEEDMVSETESIEENNEEEEGKNQAISMSDIERMEDSDDETDKDEEEVSTLSLSGDEDEEDIKADASEETKFPDLDGNQFDLAKELSDSSKCCDIVVTRLPSKEHNYELFNTYGNELSNPFLLQQYGFICHDNPNTSCLLTVQMFAYLKKAKAAEKTKRALDLKLDWYESHGFEIVNEMCGGCQDEDCHGCHEDEHDEEGCNDDGCKNDDCGGCEEKKECEVPGSPESWQLSPKIQSDGHPTKQTKALLHLLTMPFKVFYHKLARAPSERKMVKRMEKMLLNPELSDSERKILKGWVEGRLQRYKDFKAPGPRSDTIAYIVGEEKRLLRKALENLK